MELTPKVKLLYKSLLKQVASFGKVISEEKKTSIHLKNRVSFAGIHPRKDYLILNIVSASPIKNRRVVKKEQVSKNRFHNEVIIEKIEDIDDMLLSWLAEAYNLMV